MTKLPSSSARFRMDSSCCIWVVVWPRAKKGSVRFTNIPSGDTLMAFVDKRLMLAATLAVLTTAALLLAGNGMNSLLALDVGSIHPRAAARRRDHLVARRGR